MFFLYRDSTFIVKKFFPYIGFIATFALVMQNSNSEYVWDSLRCGIRIIYRYADSDVSYCGFAVNAGTRDEEQGMEGLAHYVEHMLFKGTRIRKAWHILNRMERAGGEINAYTAKEETVIYSVFLEQDLLRAVELMTDIMCNSRFPAEESLREKEVIADEINSYRDNPAELIYDEFENMVFAGHPLGHNILGDTESLARISPSDGKRFVNSLYTPRNCVFFFTGRSSFNRVAKTVERFAERFGPDMAVPDRRPPVSYSPFDKCVVSDNHQAHAIIGGRCYDMFCEKKVPMLLACNILAGPGMNSRLNVALREKRGYVYSVESIVTCYTDTGVWGIYFGTDHSTLNRCFSIVRKNLDKLRREALSSAALQAAKKQFIGQLAIGKENRENLATADGKYFLHHGKCDTIGESIAKIERVSSSDILEVANEIFSEEMLSSLVLK